MFSSFTNNILRTVGLITLMVSLPACSVFKGNGETESHLMALEQSIINQQSVIERLSSENEHFQMQNHQMGSEIISLKERLSQMDALELKLNELETKSNRLANLGSGSFGVHLASYRGVETATAGWHEYVSKYPDSFDGLEGLLEIFESPNGEVFFRLKAATFRTEDGAQQFCNEMEALSEYCMVDDADGDLIE